MKYRVVVILLAVMAGIIPSMAEEKPLKIAVIDMNRVFQEYNKTKINESKLKKQAEIYKDNAAGRDASARLF